MDCKIRNAKLEDIDNNLLKLYIDLYNLHQKNRPDIFKKRNKNELKQLLSISKSGVDEVKAGRIIARIEQLTENIEMISKNLRS